MEGPGVRRGQRGPGKASICLLLPLLSAAWLRSAALPQRPLPLARTQVAWAECACACAPPTGAPVRVPAAPRPWLRVGAGRSCWAVPHRPSRGPCAELGASPPRSLAQMCCHRCQGGPLSGLLPAAMENAGPWAGLPRRWPLTRGAPFDVSGGQVTLTVSSYAVVSVISSVCHWSQATTAQTWHSGDSVPPHPPGKQSKSLGREEASLGRAKGVELQLQQHSLEADARRNWYLMCRVRGEGVRCWNSYSGEAGFTSHGAVSRLLAWGGKQRVPGQCLGWEKGIPPLLPPLS